MGKLYDKKTNGQTNSKKGDIIKIIIEKENPENFIVLENIDYSSKVVFSLACLFASILMFVFRNKAISLWRKIAPEYQVMYKLVSNVSNVWWYVFKEVTFW